MLAQAMDSMAIETLQAHICISAGSCVYIYMYIMYIYIHNIYIVKPLIPLNTIYIYAQILIINKYIYIQVLKYPSNFFPPDMSDTIVLCIPPAGDHQCHLGSATQRYPNSPFGLLGMDGGTLKNLWRCEAVIVFTQIHPSTGIILMIFSYVWGCKK